MVARRLKEYAPKGVHDVVYSILEQTRPKRILDAPCGQGALAARIMDGEYDVYCVDINEENFMLDSVPFKKVDLNGTIPFPDESFDCVISIEGIEHIQNPYNLIKEFSRILKTGGHLILTTPNIMSIRSRYRFFYGGYFHRFGYANPDLEWEHITPLPYYILKYMLNRNGFSQLDILTNRYKKKKTLFYPIIKILVKYFTRKRAIENEFIDENLTRDELLEGEVLIIKALKRPDK